MKSEQIKEITEKATEQPRRVSRFGGRGNGAGVGNDSMIPLFVPNHVALRNNPHV